jgi:hypothetical protein
MNAPMGTERCQGVVGRDDPQDHDRRDADQATDRDGHRLGDPQDDDAEQDRRQQVLVARQVDRQQREDDRDQWREEEPDGAPRLLEALLGRAELLLPQAPVGGAAPEGGVDVGPLNSLLALLSLGRGHGNPLCRDVNRP